MKRIALFLFIFSFLLADDDSTLMSNFHAINSGIVGGHVNAITGDFVDGDVDMTVAGPEPLVVARNYSSSGLVSRAIGNEGWIWNLQSFLYKTRMFKDDVLTFTGASAGTIIARAKKDKLPETASLSELKGFTNAASSFISGKTNPKNTRVSWNKGTAVEGNGDKYTFYSSEGNLNWIKSKVRSPKEHYRSSGIRNHYDFLLNVPAHEPRSLYPFNKLEQFTPDGKAVASIKMERFTNSVGPLEMTLRGSDGQEASYSFHWHYVGMMSRYFLTKVTSSRKPEIIYGYTHRNGGFSERITAKLVGGLNLSIDYYEPGESGPHTAYRVKTLKVNHNNAMLYSIAYPKDGETVVFDGNWHRKDYIRDDTSRLGEVRHHCNGQVEFSEKFVYGARKTHEEGNLIRKHVRGRAGQELYALFYEYDHQNNINLEKIVADFMGKGEPQTLVIHHENTCDFANNPKLTWEENGRSTLRTYVPNSSLVKAVYYRENEAIKKREFRSYDSATTVLSQVIEDDGSGMDENDLTGVTERRIATFTLSREIPIGLPVKVDHHVYDPKTNEKRLVSRVEKKYLKTGEVIEERLYGSTGELKHVQQWNYDAHGNVTHHIDPIGREFVKKYDAVDRLIYAQGPRNDVHNEFEYDLENRLIAEKEVHLNGEAFVKRYQYDVMGNKIAEIDTFGNTTQFVYDDLDRLVKTIYPETELGERPTVLCEYNELGFPVKTVDAQGNVTKKWFAVTGKPYRIEYPDGSIETFEYSLESNLVKKVTVNGVAFRYTYDLQDRVVREEEIAPSGASLGIVTHEYNAFHKLKTIDRDGSVTTYAYNAEGQLCEERCGERYKNYTYDSFGRLDLSADGMTVKRFKYDLLDRVVEESVENVSGELQSLTRYGYDLSGNKSHTYLNGENLVYTEYNAKGLPVRIVDQEGLESHIDYNFTAKDALNHSVLETIATDAKGNRLITTLNTRGKVAKLCRYNAMGLILSKQENVYDSRGALVKTLHHKIVNGESLKTLAYEMEYDKMGRLVTLTEAAGEAEQKRKRHVYNALGQKVETIVGTEVSSSCQHVCATLGERARRFSSMLRQSDDCNHVQAIPNAQRR